jgi:hypothetical protein
MTKPPKSLDKPGYAANQPEGRRSVKEIADEMAVLPSTRAYADRGVIRQALRAAVNHALNELVSHKSRGYQLPSTDALLRGFGRLPGWVQSEARAMFDNIRPRVEEGSYGVAREAGEQLVRNASDRLDEEGWRPPEPEPKESPDELARLVPRGG